MAEIKRSGLGNHQLDIQQILLEAKNRWLRPAEICEILQNYKNFDISSEPASKPPGASLFLFDRKVLRYFRKDGHNWRKKKDGKTVKETHERLKVGSVDVLHCYYAHGEDNEKFQRRSYWMLEEDLSHIVLVHYREVKGNKTNVNHAKETEGVPCSNGAQEIACQPEMENSVSSSPNPSSYKIRSQATVATSLSTAQASEFEDAESDTITRMQEREIMRNMMKSHFSTADFKDDIRAVIRNEFADFMDRYGNKKQKNQEGEGMSKIEAEGMNSSEPTRLSAWMDSEIQAREWTLRKLNAWIDNPEAGHQNLEIFQASKEWFEDLMTTGMRLSDSHVDVFLHFLRMNTRHQPQPLSHNCTILDTAFWSVLNHQWEAFKCNPDSYTWDSDVMDYALGMSLKYSRPWSEVDYVYLPVNVKNDHWIAVCVELMKRKLTIYDSVCSMNQDHFDMLEPMARMLPSLLIQSGFYAQRSELSPLSKPFEVRCLAADNIPQQSGRGDCGVFMLKFVEYLSLGKPLNFTQADIPLFRKRMALDMFTIGDDSG